MFKILKKVIYKLISIVGILLSKVYTYKGHVLKNTCLDVFFTMWIRNFLGSVGDNSYISRGTVLQGHGHKNIFMGKNTSIGRNCILGCWSRYGTAEFNPTIEIGNDCSIGEYNHISACQSVIIGNGVLTGRYVYISDNNHGDTHFETLTIKPSKRPLYIKGPIIIGDNVWIGDKVSILSGVSIGESVVIAANSVVTKDIPPFSVVAGCPARILKSYTV